MLPNSKVWFYIKKFWYLPFALIAAVVLLLVFKKPDAVLKLLHIKDEAYERELAAIKKAEKEEKERKAKLQAEYEALLLKLENDFSSQNQTLQESQKKKIKELVKKYSGEELSEKFAEEFGLNMIEDKND